LEEPVRRLETLELLLTRHLVLEPKLEIGDTSQQTKACDASDLTLCELPSILSYMSLCEIYFHIGRSKERTFVFLCVASCECSFCTYPCGCGPL